MDTMSLRRTAALLQAGANCQGHAADELNAAAAEIERLLAEAMTGVSWNGFNVHGDIKSVREARRLIDCEARLLALQAEISAGTLVRPNYGIDRHCPGETIDDN